MAVTFDLPTPPSVNNLFSNKKSGGRFRSPVYKAWIEEAGWELIRQKVQRVPGQVRIQYDVTEAARFDLDNCLKATNDILVRHQIIEADDKSIVRELNLRWSPIVAGIRVTIEPMEG